jgi:hypothetical protein
VINAFKKIEIEKMGVSEFRGLTDLFIFQYLTNIFPSPFPLPQGEREG